MLTRVSALALAEHHIRVNCVVPGPVLAPPGEEETFERLVKTLPLGHAGSPEHVGQACVFLAHVFLAQSDFATGTMAASPMRVDGGEGASVIRSRALIFEDGGCSCMRRQREVSGWSTAWQTSWT
jgi:NAD(P)-dependent dehydrogenase (short-subunit alcohol dehydrogenase family)